MPKANKKIRINDTVLFKQVASVLGKGRALEELTRAYREYASTFPWTWRDNLVTAFNWKRTPQGFAYWEGINSAINK